MEKLDTTTYFTQVEAALDFSNMEEGVYIGSLQPINKLVPRNYTTIIAPPIHECRHCLQSFLSRT